MLPARPLCLFAGVVGAVGGDRIVRIAVGIGHRLGFRGRLRPGERDRVGIDAGDHVPAGVVVLVIVSFAKLRVESPRVLAQFEPVGPRLGRPPGDGMVRVGGAVEEVPLVAVLASGRTEDLGGFQQHLVDVLVAVIARGESRVLVQPEDVHAD